jgi:hypothetical protein
MRVGDMPPLRADTRECSLHRGEGEHPPHDHPLTRAILRGHGFAAKTRAEVDRAVLEL